MLYLIGWVAFCLLVALFIGGFFDDGDDDRK